MREEDIGGYKSYIDAFGIPGTPEGTYMKDSRLAKAYEVALDIRKFEIDLYWKRSSSFWLLVGGITAGLGLLFGMKGGSGPQFLSSNLAEMACCFLSAAGFFVCFAWILLNKGSKFWQRNWEYQVQILEDFVVGPLYKTVFAERNTKIMYSVTKLNECIAICFAALFAVATCFFLVGKDGISALEKMVPEAGLRLSAFAIKLIVLLIAVVFSLVAFYKAANKRRALSKGEERQEWEPKLDVKIEASIRTTELVGVISSSTAYKHWGVPRALVGGSSVLGVPSDQNRCECLYCSLLRRLRHKKV